MDFIEILDFVARYLDIEIIYGITDNNYCYCCHEDEIISMNYDDACSNEDLFMDFVEELYPRAREFNIVFWSFLHEIGHLQENEIDYEDMLLRKLLLTDVDTPSTRAAYFRLPRERAATAYAAKVISENYEKCKNANDIIEDWIERNVSK